VSSSSELVAESWFRMRHNELDREFPCDGELVETEQCTDILTVCFCLKCYTELRYTPGSSWVTVIYPGMLKSMDRPT
jgi:hypothetical protein